ncbi:MAG TPA: hypothetical protein VGF32_27950 [Streptosporangiaceae bacterium]|jgi:hypothetical protein
MTAQTTRRPERGQETRPRMVRYWVLLATVSHVLRDRGFQARVITGAIGAVALAQLGRDNQARPVRRAASWYSKLGVSEEQVARVREALEEGLEEGKEKLGLDSEPSGR